MDKILILGPEVNIDQVANKAWVVGGGRMEMQTTTTLEGKPLARPVPLTVHWSDNMLFYGTYADFVGSIQANKTMPTGLSALAGDVRSTHLAQGRHARRSAGQGEQARRRQRRERSRTCASRIRPSRAAELQKYQLLIGTGNAHGHRSARR